MTEINKRIEEVKKILEAWQDAGTDYVIADSFDGAAREICQLFPQPLDDELRKDEAKAIIRCIKDAKRVHLDWVIDDVIDLLSFREETREAIKNQSGEFVSLEEVRQTLKGGKNDKQD